MWAVESHLGHATHMLQCFAPMWAVERKRAKSKKTALSFAPMWAVESKTVPFKFSPLMAALNLPENSKNRQLRIVVLSPKGKVIYSAPVRIKQKSQTENVAFIDNIQ